MRCPVTSSLAVARRKCPGRRKRGPGHWRSQPCRILGTIRGVATRANCAFRFERETSVASDTDGLKEVLRRWTLVLGVLQITVGCIVGFIPPSAVPWFRGIVMAHIEFTANGVLMVVFGFLIRDLKLSPSALKVWFAALQLGTWTNGGAGVAAAFSGASSTLMPTINEKSPPPHGTDNLIVSGSLQLCGVTIMVALLLTIYGLARSRVPADQKAS